MPRAAALRSVEAAAVPALRGVLVRTIEASFNVGVGEDRAGGAANLAQTDARSRQDSGE